MSLETVIVYMQYIQGHPFVIYTEVFDMGLGAVLTKLAQQGERPIFFLS